MGLMIVFFSSSQGQSTSVLEGIYKSFADNSNFTSPQRFQDQQAGYWTGGGLMVRSRSQHLNPFNISLPHISAGCGKIDAFFGSLSIMKRDELVRLLQNIGSNALTYGFQLALKTAAPQVENLLSQLRKIVMDLNAMELESCQLAMNLVGGMLPKESQVASIHCQNMKRFGGEDAWGARNLCKSEDEVAKEVSRMKENVANQDILQGAYNLTWHIAKKLDFDEKTALFALSALGTIVSKKEGNKFKVVNHPGFGNEDSFLKAHLLGGAETNSYACGDKDKCLDLHKKHQRIPVEKSLKSYFMTWIHELEKSYQTNVLLSHKAEENISLLVDASSLPLLRYIEVSSATGNFTLLEDSLEFMSLQILIGRIKRLSTEIITALSILEKVQLEDSVIKSFKKQLFKVNEGLKLRARSYRTDTLWRLESQIKALETVVKSNKL